MYLKDHRIRSGALLSALAILGACGSDASPEAAEAGGAATADSVAPAAVAPSPDVPAGPVTSFAPNELGKFLVLEYHRLGEPEGEFVRKAENFRKDLQALYEAGYRPVTMRQMLQGEVDIPAGTSPVVFTIDDSSRGQFHLLEDGSIDPNSMVGMWEAFREQNPAWNNGAVWCILPGADHPSNFFGEKPSREVPRAEREATIQKKVDHLLEHDHEICNHTLYHARLDRARDDVQVQEFIGRGEDSIQVYLPDDYDIVTFALPLGMWPKTRSLAWKGAYRDSPYEYEAVLEVSGGANESPFDRRFDPHSVNRFIVAPNHLERQIAAWQRDASDRFISDGDPGTISVPAALADQVDRTRWSGKRVSIVEPTPAATPADSAATP
ncbi:MAG TPA: hypothetical protein VFZ18_12725 [Longimicrobiaceae bacterium]